MTTYKLKDEFDRNSYCSPFLVIKFAKHYQPSVVGFMPLLFQLRRISSVRLFLPDFQIIIMKWRKTYDCCYQTPYWSSKLACAYLIGTRVFSLFYHRLYGIFEMIRSTAKITYPFSSCSIGSLQRCSILNTTTKDVCLIGHLITLRILKSMGDIYGEDRIFRRNCLKKNKLEKIIYETF